MSLQVLDIFSSQFAHDTASSDLEMVPGSPVFPYMNIDPRVHSMDTWVWGWVSFWRGVLV